MSKTIELCDTRRAILDCHEHALVLGGPGCGKTTIALLRAAKQAEVLQPGQKVLFLSFSRAAVQQVKERAKSLLTYEQNQKIEIATYHLFALRVLEAHGRLLTGKVPTVISPSYASLAKAGFDGDWAEEEKRLASEEGVYTFNVFASRVGMLFTRCKAVLELYCDVYPLIIVDEFQDTDDDQWGVVQALATRSQIVCLADPDQMIFDWLGNVDEDRLEHLDAALKPIKFDLGTENHRSPQSDVLRFANAVLRNTTLPTTNHVVQIVLPTFPPPRAPFVLHQTVVKLRKTLRDDLGIQDPSIAVLARSNPVVSQISEVLRQDRKSATAQLYAVHHEIVWDADLTTAAGEVVASILEWPSRKFVDGLHITMRLIADYFRIKHGGSERGNQGALKTALAFTISAESLIHGKKLRAGPQRLYDVAQQQPIFIGSAIPDWLTARTVLEAVDDLRPIAEASRMLRLFRATDTLAGGLHDIWLSQGDYRGAAPWLRRTLERDRIIGSEKRVGGCMLMTLHKSKGKEFDGVVIVELPHAGALITERSTVVDRRLLRVGITRARHLVKIIRPRGAFPLVS